jgi:hypothetical protein
MKEEELIGEGEKEKQEYKNLIKTRYKMKEIRQYKLRERKTNIKECNL